MKMMVQVDDDELRRLVAVADDLHKKRVTENPNMDIPRITLGQTIGKLIREYPLPVDKEPT